MPLNLKNCYFVIFRSLVLLISLFVGYRNCFASTLENNKVFLTGNDIPLVDDSYVFDMFCQSAEKGDLSLLNKILTKHELIEMPIIVGYGIQQILKPDVLKDLDTYNSIREAITMIEDGIGQIEKLGDRRFLYLNTNSAGVVPVRFYLANAYETSLDYDKADSVYVTVIDDVLRDFGPSSEEYVRWSNQSASNITTRFKNYSKAIELMTPALEAALHSKQVDKSTAFDFLISYAQKNKLAGRHQKALEIATGSLERAENTDQIYKVNHLLGELNVEAGRYEEAEKFFDKAARNSPSLQDYLANYYSYANSLRISGRNNEAIALLETLGKYIDNEQLSDEDKFEYYENLAVATTFTDSIKVKEAFEKAEKYINSVTQDKLIRHIINAQVYPNDDNSFLVISALDRAVLCYNLFVKDDPRLLTELLYLLGHYYLKIIDYDKALKYLGDAYDNAFTFAKTDPLTERILYDISVVAKARKSKDLWRTATNALLNSTESLEPDSFRRLNNVSAALDFALTYDETARVEELLKEYSTYRPDDFDTMCFKIRLAIRKKDYEEAERLLKHLDNKRKDSDPDTSDLWIALCKSKEDPDIAIHAKRKLEKYKDQLAVQLLFMNSEERRNLSKELQELRNEAISFIPFSQDMKEIALDYSLLLKDLLFKTQMNISSYLSESPEAKEDFVKIKNLRKELNRAEAQGNKSLCNQLREEIGSRERYLINDYVDFEKFKKDILSGSVNSLKEKILPEETYVDLIKYTTPKDASYYVAFVIDKGPDIKFKKIGRSLKVMQIPAGVWLMLDSCLYGKKEVFFSPDAELSNVPLEYMQDENQTPYAERYNLHRVFNLCDIRPSETIGTNAIIIGVSDHNSPIGEGETLNRGSWTDLPDVKYEVDQTKKLLKNSKPKVLFNDDATEANVKALDGSDVSILHITTHGFYRSEDSLREAANDPKHDDHFIAQRMFTAGKSDLSGLVLRQGNLSWRAEEIVEEEDDLLLAEEIEQMEFPNLRLTVLSACDTGLGEIDSDGVWGLQRAFRIAGSRAIICSLAKIDDYWTSQFMQTFYEEAAKGKTIYDSFQSAHKWLKNEIPDNPEIWSSFILIE